MTTEPTAVPISEVDSRGRSREGLGLAWARYRDAVERLSKAGLLPGITEASEKAAREIGMNRLGFWLVWQLEGGFEGMRRIGMSEATIYRKISAFRDTFGKHPDEYRLPGVTIDVEAYLLGTGQQTRE